MEIDERKERKSQSFSIRVERLRILRKLRRQGYNMSRIVEKAVDEYFERHPSLLTPEMELDMMLAEALDTFQNIKNIDHFKELADNVQNYMDGRELDPVLSKIVESLEIEVRSKFKLWHMMAEDRWLFLAEGIIKGEKLLKPRDETMIAKALGIELKEGERLGKYDLAKRIEELQQQQQNNIRVFLKDRAETKEKKKKKKVKAVAKTQ